MDIPTPTYSLSEYERESVYDPAEDTFLLLDALQADAARLAATTPTFCLEIGSGSGVVTSFAAQFLKNCFFITVDVNPMACEVTHRTFQTNSASNTLGVIHGDLNCSIRPDFPFDLILCNPPYVPTEVHSTFDSDDSARHTWAGGEGGISVTTRLIHALPQLLSVDGTAYLVALSVNDIAALRNLAAIVGLQADIAMQRKVPGELLYVLRLKKDQTQS